ncbi:MAG: type I-C CRISPR-associated protein Cas5c [Bacteroidales bacterium]|nr:type I-C CRISPR-associated protein Cas5c [Bacteroidales bacterium]
MEYIDKEYCIEVWGDIACFTRPELKVERMSYDVITPSAARAIFEAILFKKGAMRWEVTKIEVLNPIRWISIRRNEVGAVNSGSSSIYIEEKRQQKNTLMLRDVRYRLYAKLVYIPVSKRAKENMMREPGNDENPQKYYSMFERRAKAGQCFTQPYLGTRECSAFWQIVTQVEEEKAPISESQDFGLMLYDLDFSNPKDITPMFFRAKMNEGVIQVPNSKSEEILR